MRYEWQNQTYQKCYDTVLHLTENMQLLGKEKEAEEAKSMFSGEIMLVRAAEMVWTHAEEG